MSPQFDAGLIQTPFFCPLLRFNLCTYINYATALLNNCRLALRHTRYSLARS